MMENHPPLKSPGVSSKRNPPKRCTVPLYSQDLAQEDHTNTLYYQGYEQIVIKVEEEEEVETYGMGDQQCMEKVDIRPIKEEEEETYVRSDQQSMEEDVIVRTIKEEEEETYVTSEQEFMEEGDMSATKEEEKMYVRNDHLTSKKGQIIRAIKKKERYLDLSTDGQDVRSTSEGRLISPPDYDAEDNGVTQYSPGGNPIARNPHHRLYHEERSPDPSNPEESSDRSRPRASKIRLKPHGANRSSRHSYNEDPSTAASHSIMSRGRSMQRSIERSMVSSTYCIEDLIRKVQANPCIFDKGDKRHSDHNYCRKIWTRITSSFFSHWHELPSKIQNQKIEEMKRKWRSVKDTFKKELQKKKNVERSGSIRNYRPRYRHFEILSFLTPYFEGRSTDDRFSGPPIVFDENAEDTQLSLASSVDAEDLQSESTPPSQPPHMARPMSVINPERTAPLKKRQKGNKNIDVEVEDQTNSDMTNIFQGILTYMQNNMEHQQQLMQRNETDHYALANSLIPLFKKIHIDLYPDLNVDLIRVCQTYISKSKEMEEMVVTNGHSLSGQPSAGYAPRYARGPNYCRPPAQSRSTPQSNRQPPDTYSQQYPNFREPTYHVMQSSQPCLDRETPPQPERTYMQALFDDHD